MIGLFSSTDIMLVAFSGMQMILHTCLCIIVDAQLVSQISRRQNSYFVLESVPVTQSGISSNAFSWSGNALDKDSMAAYNIER